MISPDEAAARLAPVSSQPTTGAWTRHGQVLLPLTRLTEEHVGQDIEITDLWGAEVFVSGRLLSLPYLDAHVGEVFLFTQVDTEQRSQYRRFALNETRFVLAPPKPAPAVDEELDRADGVDPGVAREIKEIEEDLAELEARVSALKERRAELENQLIEQFASHGVSSIVVDGRSVHTHRRTFAEYLDKPAELGGGKWRPQDLVPIFQALGKAELVTPPTMHSGRLAAIIREYLEADDGELPPELADKVRLGSTLSIRVGVARKRS